MKKCLIVGACAALALVGCMQNRGGVHDRYETDTGRWQSDGTMPSTNGTGYYQNNGSGAPGSSPQSDSGSGSQINNSGSQENNGGQ